MARKPQWSKAGRSIAIYLPQDQIDLLYRLADERQTNVSELIRRAIRQVFILPANASDASVECKAS